VELDAASLGNLLEEASDRGLGRRPLLTPNREAPDPRLEPGPSPSMLEGHGVPDVPHLKAPAPPPELTARAPKAFENPRSDLSLAGRDDPVTPLDEEIQDRTAARGKDLRARGEILK
jgi:hypothetical protein